MAAGLPADCQVEAGLPVECQVGAGLPVGCQVADSGVTPHGLGQVLEHMPWVAGQMHRAVEGWRLGRQEGAVALRHHT